MLSPTEHSLTLIRRRDRLPDTVDYRRVRREVSRGAVVRIAPGVWADAAGWGVLRPIARHRLRVEAALERAQSSVVLSHFAAAAFWGIDILGAWPEVIDTRVERGRGGRSTGLFRRHAMGIEGFEIVACGGGHHVTSPARTAVDLAAVLGFTAAVVSLDQVLWCRRDGGPLATPEEVHEALSPPGGLRGAARASRAVAFATGLSDSVRESQSRVLLHRLGFPAPVLQHPIVLPSGRTAKPDFFFPEHDHAGEFDGVGKYLDPAMLRGRTPEQALIAEKDRGDELRRAVGRLSRWRIPALDDPRVLYDILTRDGLPSSRLRPPAGATWR